MQSLGLIANIIQTVTGNKNSTPEENEDMMGMYNDLKQLTRGPKSIASESRKSIFDYPFLISSNVTSLDHIAQIIKGCEVEYMNMIILMAGVSPTTNLKDQVEIQRTLSKYHTSGADYNAYEDAGIQELSLDDAWKKANGIAYEATRTTTTTKKDASGKVLETTETSTTDTKDVEPSRPETHVGTIYSSKTIIDKYANMFNSTIVEITLRLDKTDKTAIQIPIGVHGTGHHLPYKELLYIMTRYISHQTHGFINRFIRWTSGEIKGLHNLLFRYDEIKSDIAYERRVGTSNSWIKVLRSRANNHKVNILTRSIGRATQSSLSKASDILPDCTFVISMADVDTLEQDTGVNLFTNPLAASKFLNDAMGLGLLIIDDVHEIVHVLFASYNKFTSTPIKAFAAKFKEEGDFAKLMVDLMKRV